MQVTQDWELIEKLQSYHPLVIEGMGGYDPREPEPVASLVVARLKEHWLVDPPLKPILLITQGDPYEKKGISAITRLVADKLEIVRALIFLDPNIADYHAPNADRYKVIMEIPYTAVANTLRASEIVLIVLPSLINMFWLIPEKFFNTDKVFSFNSIITFHSNC